MLRRTNASMKNLWLRGAVTSIIVANLFFVWMQLSLELPPLCLSESVRF